MKNPYAKVLVEPLNIDGERIAGSGTIRLRFAKQTEFERFYRSVHPDLAPPTRGVSAIGNGYLNYQITIRE